jgi:hypothetical protein
MTLVPPPAHATPAALLALLLPQIERAIAQGETTAAAHVLAVLLAHPAAQQTTPARAAAQALWWDLEAAICPRVIWDAKAAAAEIIARMTLTQFAAAVHNEPQGLLADGASGDGGCL